MKIGEGHVSNYGRPTVWNPDLLNAFPMMNMPAGEPVHSQEVVLIEFVFSHYSLPVVPYRQMDGDSEMLNALARGYDTNFLLHVGGKGGDLNFNPRQKKHITRQLQALLGFDSSKLVWWTQCQINGWNCGVQVR